MIGSAEPASAHWAVEHHVSGQVMKPYCVVILRSKRKGESFVKASSSDFQMMHEYAEQLHSDLSGLSNDEFVAKYELSHMT